MKQLPEKYDITQCALYKCRNKRRLEHLLQLEPGGLKRIDDIIGYHSFQIAKKNSSEERKITAPDQALKLVQKRILYLLQRVIRPVWLISGEKGKCYIDNGKAHLSGRYVLTVDIKKFYDNCTRDSVYQFFIKMLKTSPDVAEVLTNIVTFDSGIPTGCPTSQIIAFYAYYDMFEEIHTVAQHFGCTFTLYVDDMTFSSSSPMVPKKLVRAIDIVLRKYGHKPKYPKVKYYSSDDYKLITGTVVTPKQTLAAPNGLQKKIYDTFQEVKTTLDKPVCSVDEATRIASLKGQIQAARSIEAEKFPEILRLTNEVKLPEQVSSAKQKRKKKKHLGSNKKISLASKS